jgi:hypothetical protein
LGPAVATLWDKILVANAQWYSEVTHRHIPTSELKWFEIGKTNSVGNYRHFDYSSEFSQRFECLPCH